MTFNKCHMLRCALGSFSPSLNSVTYPLLTYSVLLLIRYVALWPWPLTPWPWTFVVHGMSRIQILHQIWAKSNDPRLSYRRKIWDRGAPSWILPEANLHDSATLGPNVSAPPCQIFTVWQIAAELSMIQLMFTSRFSGAILYLLFLRVGGSQVHQIWGIDTSVHLLGFLCVVCFEYQSALKLLGAEMEAIFCTFSPSCKN